MGPPEADRVYGNYRHNEVSEWGRMTYYQAHKSIELKGAFRSIGSHFLVVCFRFISEDQLQLLYHED